MLPATIRKFSYNPIARTIAQHLHLGALARRLYCRLLSDDGRLRFSCLGVTAVLNTHTSNQLAFVDCVVTRERDVIEETLHTLMAGDTFLDVGCHYGVYSIIAAKLVGSAGRVIAIEPHPDTFRIFQENVDLNQCANVEMLNVALSDETGSLALSFNENGSHRQRPSDPVQSVHIVPMLAGDEVVNSRSVPALIKIDVEGHEFAVLSGLKRTLSDPNCRVVGVEVHPLFLPPGITRESVIRLLRDCGFDTVKESARPSMTDVSAGEQEIWVVASKTGRFNTHRADTPR